jgi:thymidylate synthase
VIFRADSFSSLYRELVAHILAEGTSVAPRGLPTIEILACQLCLTNPRARVLQLKDRLTNPGFAVAEAVWMLTGSDEPWIYDFNSRLHEFTDDGVLRGAYGPRICSWAGHLDQLRLVRDKLRQDPSTRQAVVQIFDPSRDWTGARDVPCTIGHRFFLRDGRLHMHATLRSQDAWLGLPYDLFANTVLQEVMAGWLDAELGDYVHWMDSLHLYERDRSQAEALIAADGVPIASEIPGPLTVGVADFGGVLCATRDGRLDHLPPSGWREFGCVLASYRAHRAGRPDEARELAAEAGSALGSVLERWFARAR